MAERRFPQDGREGKTAELAFHRFADLFPLLDDKALAELAADIKDQSQREPIFVWQGQIIDGRNRYRACKLAKVEPVIKRIEFPGGEAEALAYVVSRNLKRRHLFFQQRVEIAAKIANMRQGARTELVSPSVPGAKVSQAQAAEMLDVSVASVKRAKAVIDLAPELLEQVRTRKLSLRQAADIARHGPPETPEPEPEPDGVTAAKDAKAKAEASQLKTVKLIDRDTARMVTIITGRGQTTERLLDALSEGDILEFLERKRAKVRAAGMEVAIPPA